MRHSRLWWAAILVPVAAIGGIELLADWILDPYLSFPFDTLVVTATVLVVTGALVMLAQRRMGLLALALDARTRELEKRGATARALHQLGVTIAATRDLGSVLQAVADATRFLLDGDVALVMLQAGESSRLAAQSGPAEAFLGNDAEANEPEEVLAAPWRRSLVAAPLHRGETTIGVLAVGGREERGFEVGELETLSSLANLLTLAIENARLEAQLREVAVRGERERIAREMHDGLAQVLGYVNTKSQAVEELLRLRRTTEARAQLAELAAAARSIYVDVREAILGLSSPVTPDRGLVGALDEYASRYAASAKLAVSFTASPETADFPISPETEAQAFRIVQEALTNVRKHAAAASVAIEVDCHGPKLEVRVADDGRGLGGAVPRDGHPTGGVAPSRGVTGWPHFGLAAMRERAAAIGAELSIADRPEGGTCVTLRLAPEAAEGRGAQGRDAQGREAGTRESGDRTAVGTGGGTA